MRFQWLARTTSSTTIKLRTVRWLSLLLRGFLRILHRPTLFEIARGGLSWQVDAHEAIDCCLILTGDYEPEVRRLYQQYLRAGDVAIDIGANIGAHALPMAQKVGEGGRVYALEATEYAFQKLQKNIALNPVLQRQLKAEHIFLTNGERDDTQQVSASWNIERRIEDPQRHRLDGGIACELGDACKLTLDQWIQERGLERLDLLKIDVDGNEVQVLQGAQATLARFRPRVLMELSPIHYEGRPQTFVQQVELLTNLGYKLYDHRGYLIEASARELEALIPRGVLLNVMGVMT